MAGSKFKFQNLINIWEVLRTEIAKKQGKEGAVNEDSDGSLPCFPLIFSVADE